MQHKEARVNEYPHLRKVDSAFVVNTNNDEYHRALGRRKQEKAAKDLVNRVTGLERKMDLILELLTNKEK